MGKKTAVITGANRGIGMAIVKKMAQNDVNVFACAREKTDDFENEIIKLSKEYSVNITPIYFDLQDEEAVKKGINLIYTYTKKIDALINNAGMTMDGLFNMMSVSDVKKVFQVNFFAPLYVTQLISRSMIRNKKGTIVNIASVSGIESEVGRLAYGSSKAALLFATKTLSQELGPFGIRVNAVSPGFIDTDMWKNRDQKLYEKVLNETPLKCQGTPEDVADVVYFLIQNEKSFINGSNIIVDGGRLS